MTTRLCLRAIVVAGVLQIVSCANLYTDYEARRSKASEMLRNLYSSARSRADRLRRSDGKDPSEAVPSSTDMFARLIDYSTDRLNNPPLKSVETNLLLLQRAILSVAQAVAPLVQSYNEECQLEGGETVCGRENAGAELIANVTRILGELVPVQGERHTLL